MPKCIISLGSIKKKLFIPLLYIILYIFINIYHDYIAEDPEEFDIVTLYIEGFGTTISEVMIFFIGNAFRYTNKRKLMKKLTKQNYLKDLSILFILTVFYMANTLSPFYLKEEGEKKDDTSRELYIIDAIELIFITIATHFFLKYNYYIHHIISIIIIVILCLINDIILQNFTHTNIYVVISSITLILADSFLYSYFKYLIDDKYYFFMDVLFIYGIFNFTCYFISFISIMIIHILNGSYEIFFQFYYFYIKKGALYIIFRFFFGLIFVGFFADILEFLMLDKLSPNYVIIGYELGRIPSNLIGIHEDNRWSRWVILILLLLQIMSLLFYLEILEYNFCSLNIDTRKNIKERELSQSIECEDEDEDINSGIDGYYLPRINQKNKDEINHNETKDEELFDK